MRFKKLVFSSGVFALTVAAILTGCNKTQQATSGPVDVGVVTVKAEDVVLTTYLPGRTEAFRVAEVRPQVTGIILKRLFKEGADVKRGQQLYQIDAATYEARQNKARANLLAAENLAKRYEKLRDTKAISKQQYDNAVAAWHQAQAESKMANIDVVYTKVLSPISGRIGRSSVTEGALVTNGQAQALATVQQITPIYVDVTQPMAEILKLQREMAAGNLESAEDKGSKAKVSLTLEDGSEYSHEGTIELSEISVDKGTGSVTLRAVFPNPDGMLLPGMFVHTKLKEGVRKEAILIPQQAVVREVNNAAMVWVIGSDNKVDKREVQTVRTVGNTWLISGGLKPGERIVTEGIQRLRPGMVVNPTDAKNVKVITDFTAASKESSAPSASSAPNASPAPNAAPASKAN